MRRVKRESGARKAQISRASTSTPASPLVIRWLSSISVSMRSGRWKISPLQVGQWLPQPAPDPVARTTAPHRITRML